MDPFGKAIAQVYKMESLGKVDPSIIQPLDEIASSFVSLEKAWAEAQGTALKDAFVMYHGVRNGEMVTRKMLRRFREAAELHDNPRIAQESLMILPILENINSIARAYQTKRVGADGRNRLLERVRQLREVAASTSMLPSPQEELQDADLDLLKKQGRALAAATKLGRSGIEGAPRSFRCS